MTARASTAHPKKRTFSSYLRSLAPDIRHEAEVLATVFRRATGMEPVMWGDVVGFGSYHYTYPSGREGDHFAAGFAMRKSGPSVYLMPGYADYTTLLKKFGRHTMGASCLSFKHIHDVELGVLSQIIKRGLKDLEKEHSVTPS